ncbi:MAG TPA: hypothetical protein VF603_05945 [Allosphingosinicella sp.]|jgi:hypothetical protein
MRSPFHLLWRFAALALMLQAWAPARAQSLDQPQRPPHQEQGAIVVTAQRPIGAAIGNPEPERQLDPGDVAAYGAGNLRELVEALSLQTRGSGVGAGPALVLLNGRRIASFSEIGDIPPEAVLRIDILPEEVARRYGHPVGSKVLNIVLRPSYSVRAAELAYSESTAGGRASPEGSFTIARNGSGLRWNLNATAAHNELLLESERRVSGGFGSFRSLLPGLDRFTIAGTVARARPTGVSYSANARAEIRRSLDLTGPAPGPSPAARALRREREDTSLRLGASAHGQSAGWQWTAVADAQFLAGETRGERGGAAPYRAEVERVEFSLDGLANRTIARLPAGEAGLNLRAAFSESVLRSRSSLSPGPEAALSRSRGTASVGLDLPLSSRAQGGLGDLSLGLSADAIVDNLRRTLFRLDASVNWAPVRPLTIGLGFNRDEDAPSLEDLGSPAVTLENVSVFDFTRGETAIVRLRTGGNPSLRPSSRETLRAGATLRPVRGLNLSATFTRSRGADTVGPFPAITQEVEQAFPQRFSRDAQSRLTEVDQSPINFSREARDQIRWGFNWDLSIGRQGRVRGDGSASAREAAAAVDRDVRLNLSLFHTLRLRDDLLVREGLPRLDFLAGSVAGIGGGRARNLIETQASAAAGGLGARLSGSIEGGSRTVATSGELLRFSAVGRFDLRLFADLGQLMPRRRWTAGTRISLQVGNLFDSRVRVRGAAGTAPDGLQSAYLEPLGRTVRFSLRRIF